VTAGLRMAPRMSARVGELVRERVPFVHATVVRAQCPTSAHPGDDAVVLADGSIEGFVGGHCAEESVRSAALDALKDEEPLLLRILPEDATVFPDATGSRVVVNPCLSGGAIEIFLEPLLPSPQVLLVGPSPVADSVARLGDSVGFSCVVASSLRSAPLHDSVAAVISSHGRDEVESIRLALDAGIMFIGLVASHKRGEAVLASMGLTDDERRRVHTPVGLDIGARTTGEIALSIVAALVRAVRVEGVRAPRSGQEAGPQLTVDPVCGMTVVVGPRTPSRLVDGRTEWFCSPACRDR
jgi:xanthine dehydrogenase accessory factor